MLVGEAFIDQLVLCSILLNVVKIVIHYAELSRFSIFVLASDRSLMISFHLLIIIRLGIFGNLNLRKFEKNKKK